MARWRLTLANLLFALCCGSTVFATGNAAITVTRSFTKSYAVDTIGQFATNIDRSVSIPTVPYPLQLDAIDGESYAKTAVDWSSVNGETVLSFHSNLKRVGNKLASAYLAQPALEFVANESASYDISGYLNVVDVDEYKSGIVNHHAYLYDDTIDRYLLDFSQYSNNTHDEQLTLGGHGGDRGYRFKGSLIGTLIAGHKYWLEFSARIATDDEISPGDADSGASAVATFTLKLRTIPEPTSLSLAAMLGLVALNRRQTVVATSLLKRR